LTEGLSAEDVSRGSPSKTLSLPVGRPSLTVGGTRPSALWWWDDPMLTLAEAQGERGNMEQRGAKQPA
jgi:hypothetical protein